MGPGFVTGAGSIGPTASGHLRASSRRAAINVWLKKLCALSTVSGCQTRNSGIGWMQRGRGLEKKAGGMWNQMQSLSGVGWVEGKLGLETGSLLHLGGDQGAPKGAEWALEKDLPGSRWGIGGWR